MRSFAAALLTLAVVAPAARAGDVPLLGAETKRGGGTTQSRWRPVAPGRDRGGRRDRRLARRGPGLRRHGRALARRADLHRPPLRRLRPRRRPRRAAPRRARAAAHGRSGASTASTRSRRTTPPGQFGAADARGAADPQGARRSGPAGQGGPDASCAWAPRRRPVAARAHDDDGDDGRHRRCSCCWTRRRRRRRARSASAAGCAARGPSRACCWPATAAGSRTWRSGAVTALPAGSVATAPRRLRQRDRGAPGLARAGHSARRVGIAARDGPAVRCGRRRCANVANVAFRTAEPVRECFDRQQALALHAGSIDGFFAAADLARAAAGANERWIPTPGYHERVFSSDEAISTGRGRRKGSLQHYGVYLPAAAATAARPRRSSSGCTGAAATRTPPAT